MLVLSRRPGDSLTIGDGITVRVLSVRGDTIRLGVDAPRSVQVHRTEVLDAVKDANEAAAAAAATAPATPSWLPAPPTTPEGAS